MALIKCKECGHMISDKAMKCPKCGYSATKKEEKLVPPVVPQVRPVYSEENEGGKSKTLYTIIGILAILLIGGGLYMWHSGLFGENETDEKMSDDIAVQDTIKSEDYSSVSLFDETEWDNSEYQNDVEILKNEETFESSESSEKDGKLEYYSESTEEDKPETYKEDINNSNSIKKRNDAEWQNRIWDKVDVPPSFPGGQSALLYWLASHVKYPPDAEENGIQGRVIVGFVIERDGSVSQVQVLRGVAPSLDKEAVRVVESMPKWTPGKQDGQNVRVKFNVPVNFRLG